jgi:hypothetical protein
MDAFQIIMVVLCKILGVEPLTQEEIDEARESIIGNV